MNEEINKKDYKTLYPFKGWVLENFPFIEADFDAVTNYELMCKVTEYLNNVIYNQNQVQDLSDELVDGYNALLNYVNSYFDNLSVQNEVNIKLDEMALDGSLTQLIKNYVDPFIDAQDDIIDQQNALISEINTKVNSAVSGSPIAVSSADLMTDTTKIYVLTTDGYWYYYDGDSWEQGGIYQSSVASDDVLYLQKKDASLNYNQSITFNLSWTSGYRLTQGQGTPYADANFSITDYLPYDGVYKQEFTGLTDGTSNQELIAFYDKDYTFLNYEGTNAKDKINLIPYPSNAKYFRLSIRTEHISGDGATATQHLLSNRRINEINGALNELDLVNVYNKNITTNVNVGSSVTLTPSTSNLYKYIILDCEEGDLFAINGKGGNNPRLWAFIDGEDKLISKSDNAESGLKILKAPLNAKKLICNFDISGDTPLQTWNSFYVYRLLKPNLTSITTGYNLAEDTGVTNKNINTNVNVGEIVTLTPESVNNYTYIIVNCDASDKFIVNGHGGINPRLWAFIDSNNKLLAKSASNKSGQEIITAPTGSKQLICNFQTIYDYSLYSYSDINVNNMNDRLTEIEKETEIISYNESYPSPENYGSCYVRSLKTVKELTNYLTDFKKPSDLMCHVGTFKIINNNVYVTYYGSETSTVENPSEQIVRFVIAPLNNLSSKTYYTIQEVGDTFDDHEVTAIYDTVLMTIDNDDLYIMWTCQLDGVYTRLYKVYNITSGTFGNISYNYFKVNNTTLAFNTTNMNTALNNNGIEHKTISVDIGLMQKITSHIDNGTTYYYTGCYAGEFNCIVKSTDLETWEYVSAPTFENNSQFENACYVKGDKCFYFLRQKWQYNYGLLSYYDISSNTWHEPTKLNDTQSRSDFFEDNSGLLYLVHANHGRNHITITRIDTDYIVFNQDRIDAWVIQGFYPYVDKYNNEFYMIYTQARQHMYFVKFTLGDQDETINNKLYNLLY